MFGLLKPTHEIHVRRDGRWSIECLVETENEALGNARRLLSDTRIGAVRIVRCSPGLSNKGREKEIFYQEASALGRGLTLSGSGEDASPCQTVEHLYLVDARLAVGRMLREWLRTENILPFELFCLPRRLDKLQDQGLMGAMLHQVGMAQANALGIMGRERVVQLQGLTQTMQDEMARARQLATQVGRLDLHKPEDQMAVLMGIANETMAERAMACLLSDHLQSCSGLYGRFVWLIHYGRNLEPHGVIARLVGQALADALAFPEVIQELFGPLPSLAEFLTGTADMLAGRGVQNYPRSDRANLVALSQWMRQPAGQEARQVMVDWLARELASDHPLDKRDIDGDAHLLVRMMPKLRDEDGKIVGGPPIEQAILRRRLRHRQALLRRLGQHEQAEKLARAIARPESLAPSMLVANL